MARLARFRRIAFREVRPGIITILVACRMDRVLVELFHFTTRQHVDYKPVMRTALRSSRVVNAWKVPGKHWKNQGRDRAAMQIAGERG
uniref:Uncharacterized protein n=1 Tax=Sphaerodactylus townsendi TaxID=933632 RepID=A0ACB8EIV9_9SAUR